MSRIAVFGATGLTGGLVVEQALAQGHEVVALVRDPGRMTLKHPGLVVMGGSPTSPHDVARCVQGADAVIHCLGIGGKGDGRPTTLVSDSVKVVLRAMQQHGVQCIVCMSNVGAGGSGSWLANRLVIPLLLRWLVPIIEDKDRMEAALRASSVAWVSVRLPNIVAGPDKPLRVSPDSRGLGLSITAESAARFLLAQAAAPDYVRSTPSISNGG
ncbi:MAG: NAD(P)H-binding protein [Burkholderiales bacterium]|nr:NAD(P)H-binding protein [Burkholderiales bacterium]